MTTTDSKASPAKKVVGLGYFAGSLHEMSHEEHVAKLRSLEYEVPCRKCYVRVRLADVNRTLEWRTVVAHSLEEAIKVVERMPDVEVCLEASFVPGGVVT